jgi:catechol 2,3-dioxygenase-like lactoylglutathione lyase family enzyme
MVAARGAHPTPATKVPANQLWAVPGSNQRPPACKAGALPTELTAHAPSGKEPNTTAHVAFQADDRATVDAFHAAATSAGGTDEGAPDVREHYHPCEHYHPSYYAAFVADPDGNNIEAVCHKPT